MTNKFYDALAIHRRAHLKSIGLNEYEFRLWGVKWNALHSRARRVRRLCTLTYEQYTQMAADAGIKSADEIGLKPNSYQVGRYGDEGDYVVGNCRFIVKEQNLKERWMYKSR